MEIQYVIFGLAWLAFAVAYIWFVVRMVRDVHATAWLREAEAARALWTVMVIVWVPFGPLVWLLYRGWRERHAYSRTHVHSHR